MNKPNYQAIALKIVPTGCQPTLTYLRKAIAETLEREIQSALFRQKEEAFPDLEATRLAWEQGKKQLVEYDEAMKRKYKEREAELDQRAQQLDLLQYTLEQTDKRLQTLLAAFDAYSAWLDGEGEIDENGARFEALQKAYLEYKKGTKKC